MTVINTPQTNPHLPVANQNMGLGTAFKIMNTETKTESFCIGTIHFASKEMIEKSCFHRMIPKCAALFTEAGKWMFFTSPHLTVPESPHIYRHIKHRFALDDAITLEAYHRKIPIVSLDYKQGIAEMDQYMNKTLYQAIQKDSFTLEKKYLHDAELVGQLLTHTKEHDSTLQGNLLTTEEARTCYLKSPKNKILLEKREKRWSEILIPILQHTEQPICIAVGACHLVGENCLLDLFRKAGFQVEQIRSTCPKDYERFAPPCPLAPRTFFRSPGWLHLMGRMPPKPKKTASPTPPLPEAQKTKDATKRTVSHMTLRPRSEKRQKCIQ